MAWINKDWLKKLGLEMPKTTDDLIKVLEAFKNGDQMEMERLMKFHLHLLVVTETKIFKIPICCIWYRG